MHANVRLSAGCMQRMVGARSINALVCACGGMSIHSGVATVAPAG